MSGLFDWIFRRSKRSLYDIHVSSSPLLNWGPNQTNGKDDDLKDVFHNTEVEMTVVDLTVDKQENGPFRNRSDVIDRSFGPSDKIVLSDPEIVSWMNKDAYVYKADTVNRFGPDPDLEFVIYIPIDTAVHWLHAGGLGKGGKVRSLTQDDHGSGDKGDEKGGRTGGDNREDGNNSDGRGGTSGDDHEGNGKNKDGKGGMSGDDDNRDGNKKGGKGGRMSEEDYGDGKDRNKKGGKEGRTSNDGMDGNKKGGKRGSTGDDDNGDVKDEKNGKRGRMGENDFGDGKDRNTEGRKGRNSDGDHDGKSVRDSRHGDGKDRNTEGRKGRKSDGDDDGKSVRDSRLKAKRLSGRGDDYSEKSGDSDAKKGTGGGRRMNENDGDMIKKKSISEAKTKSGRLSEDDDRDRVKGKPDWMEEAKNKNDPGDSLRKERTISKKPDENETDKENGTDNKKPKKKVKYQLSKSETTDESKPRKKKKNVKPREPGRGLTSQSSSDASFGPKEFYIKHNSLAEEKKMQPHRVDFHHKVYKHSMYNK